MEKRAWVSLPAVYRRVGFEKAASQLADMGIEIVHPIVSSGGGTYYPSKVRPQAEEFSGKDLVTPFVREAKRRGLEVSPWIVSMNLHHEKFARDNRDLYVVNKLGTSCVDDPPYIRGYKWLCPSREENRENLAELFIEVGQRFDVDGLHFDYIRLPDVILPRGLRGKYPGVPEEDVILPRFDYCYCDVCRETYSRERGVDPMGLSYIEPEYGKWFRWRADRITDVVRYVYGKVKGFDASIEVSAAVFATPELSYEYVFQDWPSWGIDLYSPMIYHKYYGRDHRWIGKAAREGALRGVDLCAGILLGFFERKADLVEAVQAAVDNGALGVTLFVYPPPRGELIEWAKEALSGKGD